MSRRIQKLPGRKPRLSLSNADSSQLQKALEDALKSDEQPPPTVAGIARRFGYPTPELYKRYPKLSHAVAARYLADISVRKSERMQRLRAEIREAALQLYAEGKSITKHHISPRLPKPGYLRSPELREFVEEVRRELEEFARSG